MHSGGGAPDPPTSSTPPPTDDTVDALAPLPIQEHRQHLHSPDPPVSSTQLPTDDTANSAAQDSRSASDGFSRHPSWLPEDQQYLKGAAVGPSDSMLVTAAAVPLRNCQEQQQQALSTSTPTTAWSSLNSSNPENLDNPIAVGENPPTAGAGDNGTFQVTIHLVEEGRFTRTTTGNGNAQDSPAPRNLVLANAAGASQPTICAGDYHAVLATARLVEEDQTNPPNTMTCLPNTHTHTRRWMCFGIVVVLVAVSLTGILCGGGVCSSSKSNEPPPLIMDTVDAADTVMVDTDTMDTAGTVMVANDTMATAGTVTVGTDATNTAGTVTVDIMDTAATTAPTRNTSSLFTNFCGSTWSDAAATCGQQCPIGNDSECPSGKRCFTGVTTCGSPTQAPVVVPTIIPPGSPANYCGLTWSDAAATCGQRCPSALDSECPSGLSCFAEITGCGAPTNTPPSTPTKPLSTPTKPPAGTLTSYCGLTWSDAAAKCNHTCPSGMDFECPSGTRCFGDITTCKSTKVGVLGDDGPSSTSYCGVTWIDAATMCNSSCPGGMDSECPSGTYCYGDITPCKGNRGVGKDGSASTNYCGVTWEDAAAGCIQACPGGIDGECPSGTYCFGDITTCTRNGGVGGNGVSSTNYCGVSWEDAAAACIHSCPGGFDSECPSGTYCFGDITSCNASNTSFCGATWEDAAARCNHTCPRGIDKECPADTYCFADVTTCKSSTGGGGDTSYCGATWYDAASICNYTCPGGMDSECPVGTYCYSDITICKSNSGVGGHGS
jgi:hypothetical protein